MLSCLAYTAGAYLDQVPALRLFRSISEEPDPSDPFATCDARTSRATLPETHSTEASDGAKSDAKPGDQPKIARASKLEFKTVNEVYVFN
jgi:hypothetical protein